MKEKILIVGGNGFVGKHLVKHIIKNKKEGEPVILDVKKEGSSNYTQIWKSSLDITREDLEGMQYIVYLAAQADVPLAIKSPRYTYQVNVMSALHFLEILRECKTIPKKILYMSSESVYGHVSYEELPIKENTPTNPVNIYGASKLAAEQLFRLYAGAYGLPIVIIRSGTVYGEGMRRNQVVSIFLKQALLNEPITIEGDGSKKSRDLNYVANLVDGIMKALYNGRNGSIYNIASGTETFLEQLAKVIKIVTMSKSDIITKEERVGESGLRLVLDITKAKNELGYEPKVNLVDGLMLTARDILDELHAKGLISDEEYKMKLELWNQQKNVNLLD